MKTVIFCRGIPGSGKSTWAKQWTQIDPEHRIRISWDDLRNMMGKYWVPNREKIVKLTSIHTLEYAMMEGYDIVIDNMNLSEKSIEDFIKTIRSHNSYVEDTPTTECSKYSIEYRDFKTPLEVCIERDSKREAPIGKEVITNTYNKYKSFYEGD